MDKAEKTKIVEKFAQHERDTGSAEVQVALFTDRIKQLTGHMAANKHDYHTQLGLVKLVGKRRRMLIYLSKEDIDRYHKLIKQLGLRK